MCVCHRVLFVIRPRPGEAEQTDLFRQSLGRGVPVERERLHATLWISDDYTSLPRGMVERLHTAGKTASAEPFRIVLNRLNAWERSVVLRPEHPSAAAKRLAHELGRQTRMRGEPPRPSWRFNFHVTLLYARRKPFVPFSRSVDPIMWHAQDFVLIHSVVGEHRHIELGRWPLTAPPPPEQLAWF